MVRLLIQIAVSMHLFKRFPYEAQINGNTHCGLCPDREVTCIRFFQICGVRLFVLISFNVSFLFFMVS